MLISISQAHTNEKLSPMPMLQFSATGGGRKSGSHAKLSCKGKT